MALIELDHISKTYDLGDTEVHALRDIHFSIEPGEFVAIMGPSGSGKSTLMNIIGCLDEPTAGGYRLDGIGRRELDRRRAGRRCATARSASSSRAST